MFLSQIAETLQESVMRRHHAHVACDGFDDDASNILRKSVKVRLYGCKVVEYSKKSILRERCRYAGAVRYAVRQRA